MAVKIRLTRMGRRHRPFFRINAIESRNPRDGKVLEKLGHYDPIEKNTEKQIILNKERINYWLDQGAIPSDTVSEILLKFGIKHKYAEQKAARRVKAKAIAESKGKFFTKAQKIAAQKEAEAAAEKAKAEAEARAKAEEEKTKAEAEARAKAEEEKAKKEAEEKAAAEKETAETEPQAQAEAQEKESEASEDKSTDDSESEAEEK
jgi:small subunit ribosomal protein S16